MKKVLTALSIILFASTASAQTNIESIRRKLEFEDNSFSGSVKASLTTRLSGPNALVSGFNSIVGFKHSQFLFLNYNNANFVKSNSEINVADFLTHLRVNYYFSKNFAWESIVQYQGNQFNELQSRFILGLGPRFSYNLKDFVFAFGTSYLEEVNKTDIKYTDSRWNNYLSIFYNVDPIQFSSTFYIQPLFKDFSNYRFSNNTSFNVVFKSISTGIIMFVRRERAYYFQGSRNSFFELKNTFGVAF